MFYVQDEILSLKNTDILSSKSLFDLRFRKDTKQASQVAVYLGMPKRFMELQNQQFQSNDQQCAVYGV